jgi:hypothetical protein
MKALLASIVTDPRYLAADVDTSLSTRAGAVPKKLVTADLLASSVEGLTGYRWTQGGYDLLQDDTVGVRTLAGGADGYAVTQSATRPNATLLLVQERLAEAAAWHVVHEAPERLLPGVDLTAGPDEDAAGFGRAVARLHLAILGHVVAEDGEEVVAAATLWRDVSRIERDPRAAWAGLVAVLLRDPDFLLY